eukprot:TRINITY_DN377_c0_g2_i8.p1 TRINITY_DN377_c0_g2~~TRINITY_DN377_c0_g2_i8.p1  ORF type:complete len:378 (-),score=87.23 TRINITY_DN377_c0_g2_i8:145-1278(-)
MGSLSTVKGTSLASTTLKAALERTQIPSDHVNEVIYGNVLQAGQGQAPARQVAIGAGLPPRVVCTTINKVCASGMKAVMFASQSIRLGENEVVVAGGFESMSNVPYYLDRRARGGLRYGDAKILDAIVNDGLWDVYNNFHMGNCAEECAKKYSFTREEQDKYAISSYERSAAAVNAGHFLHEIVPVTVDSGKGKTKVVDQDEEFKNVNFDKISSLKPAFLKDGTVTAANASTLNDGASTLIVASAEYADKNNLTPLARIVSYGDAETLPVDFPIAPALAIPIALSRAGLKKEDIDFWEINEAFSVVVLANIKLLDLDPSIVNVNGGGVSLGHPIGCSGARILTTLIHHLQRTGKKYGCAAICNGGGGASAVIVENLS